ncbi:MAG: hypothetical protein ACXVCH_17160, partial [Bdellovibrionota bacterium]
PQDYFRELITRALSEQKVRTRPETEFYLVNLLNQFMCSERLSEEPLAFMIKEAIEAPSPETQTTLFRKVGDVSLYVAGYFQDSLNRKLVDVDYYIEMGGTAYNQVAVRTQEGMYRELAEKFSSFVEVLADVSDRTTPKTEKDILRLYELWVRTRSERAAKALQEAGILPNDTIKKDWQ